MAQAEAIISIRSPYAAAILSGSKTVELRRRFPSLEEGTLLWIYSPGPEGAIVGQATIAQVLRASPNAIWRKHRKALGLSWELFQGYCRGTQQAVAVVLKAPTAIEPLSRSKLKKVRSNFHPPQVATRLSEAEALKLRRLSEAAK